MAPQVYSRAHLKIWGKYFCFKKKEEEYLIKNLIFFELKSVATEMTSS
jgi:hypothetical protein